MNLNNTTHSTTMTNSDKTILVFEPLSHLVAHSLVATDAYKVDLDISPENWYVWKSGIKAPCYCNCRKLLSFAEKRHIITSAFSDAITYYFPSVTVIVGMATAGIPWASLLAQHLELPMAYIRSTAKQHGLGKMLEGHIGKNDKIVLIDDLVASGRSIKTAAETIQTEVEAEILGIQSIVNWNFLSMQKELEGYRFHSLVSYPQILKEALNSDKISFRGYEQLFSFYMNPWEYRWG